MRRQREDNPTEAAERPRPGGSSFRWPSRRHAAASERAADEAARQGLARLRARAPQNVEPEAPADARPEPQPEPDVDSAPPPEDSAPSPPSPDSAPSPPPDPGVEAPRPEPAPDPWDAELDALTEALVADLRRALGPDADLG